MLAKEAPEDNAKDLAQTILDILTKSEDAVQIDQYLRQMIDELDE